MLYIKYNTASQILPLGPLVGTDGTTPYTTALANTEIKLWKPGGTSLVSKNSGGSTHMASGIHYATFDATDSNTMGMCTLYVIVASQLIFKDSLWVMQANVFESLGTGLEYLEVTTLRNDVTPSGGTITVQKRDGSTTQYTQTYVDSPTANVITQLGT